MNGIKKATLQVGKVLSWNSPTILTGLSVAGLVTTTIMAVRATPKALLILEEEGYPSVTISKSEIVKLTWRCYVPTIFMCGATIACVISANSINLRRNAALVSLYTLTEASFKEYQAQVIKTIGEKKERKIKDEVYKSKLEKNPVGKTEVVFTGKGETLCFETTSGRYFKNDIETIKKAMNELNRDLLNDMWLPLNDVYYAFGLPATKLGKELGWDIDNGLIDFIFSSQLTDGVPCLVIDYNITPSYEYRDY